MGTFKNVMEILRDAVYYRAMAVKYHKYPLASKPRSMAQFAYWIKEFSNLNVKNVFEIGANFGQDAETLRHCFQLDSAEVYVFEAHPEIYKAIRKLHKFNAYNYAVYNSTGSMSFNICDIFGGGNINSGISTLLKDKRRGDSFKTIDVKAIRMDEWMQSNNIDTIYFLKLDVEGANFEVLEGFGNRLKDVAALHIEAEHIEEYEGEILWDGIQHLLVSFGFEMIYFQRYKTQSDSFWIQKKYMK